jgi:TonB-linked SusC/RagA family outer membrane protein
MSKNQLLTPSRRVLISMAMAATLGLGITQSIYANDNHSMAVMQSSVVKGIIIDESGEPVIGASVMIKGTTKGTISDARGQFSLEAGSGSTLVVSYVGFVAQEIKLTGQKNVKIILSEDRKALNEVVVVGYGTQRKEELTSSVMSVKAKDFVQVTAPDAAALIRGKVAGLTVVQPDANPLSTSEIMLRGVTTLKSGASPLVIIDGVQGSLNSVSPNDIQQIDILKDGSAAAIYGTRGTNGVIIITTKRSNGQMEPTIDINSYISTQQITKKLGMMTTEQYKQKVADGVPGAIDHGGDTNWLDEILQTPLNQTYSVSIKGGSSKTNYVGSVDYTSNEGLVKKSKIDVLYPRLNVVHHMWGNLLKIEAQLSGFQRSYGIPYNSNVYNGALLYNPTYSVKHEDGTWNEDGSSPLMFNPVALLEETKGENKGTDVRMYTKLTLNPIEGLNISYLASREIYNLFSGYSETKRHESNTMSGKNGYASRSTTRTQNDLMELTAQYTKKIGKHSLNALLGYSWNKYNYQTAFMDNYDFATDDYSYNNMSQGKALVNGKASESSYQSEYKLVGYFGRFNYNYANRYFLSASIRHEGSSKFGSDHKWGTFPAVSVGWNIKGEDFMSNIKVLSALKLRVGYGVTGTVPNDPYMSLNRLNLGGYGYFNGEWINMLRPSGNPNPDLRWEKKKETNVGLDFGFLNDRLTGSIDFYNRTTDDLIWDYSVPVPPYVSNTITANAGTIKNTGVEVSINAIPVQTKDFSWNTNVNFSTNKNKLVSLSNDKYIAGSYVDAGTIGAPIQQSSHRLQEGEPLGNFYGYKSIDIDNDGYWIIEGKDGNPKSIKDQQPDDKQIIGNGLPKWYLNFNNTVNYKQFDLSVTMRGAFGFQILNTPEMFYGAPVALGNGNALEKAFDVVYGKRALAYDQTLQYVSYYVQDGDYWKIDNVTLGFTPNLKSLKWIKRLRIYASVSNLATITGYSGIDPEVNVSGLAPGVDDMYRYPSARTYTFGINLTF